MLSIIYGRAGSGKTQYIFDRLSKKQTAYQSTLSLRGDETHEYVRGDVTHKRVLLVPDQFSMFCERTLIETMGAQAQAYTEVLSFSRLANRVLNEAGPLRVNYIDNAAKNMLIEKALSECGKDLAIFRKNAAQSGFSSVVAGVISEFKRYGVTPDALLSASERTDNRDLKNKLSDISLIYNGYCDLLNSGYTDMEDNLSVAAQRIHLCKFFENTEIFIDNFKSFSPVEYDILTQLLLKTDVTIALCCDDIYSDNKVSVFTSAAAAFKKLSRICAENNIPISGITHLDSNLKHRQNPDLSYLERAFFTYTAPPKPERTENITVYFPQNYYHELDEACKLIKCLITENGYKSSEICMLARDFDNYDGIIPALFDKYSISYFLDQKNSIAHNPIMRHICSVVEILAYGFSYERVMNIAKSGFCGIDELSVDLLENYILAADVSYRLWRNDDDYKSIDSIPEEYMNQVNAARRAVISPVMRLIKSISGRKTVTQICESLNNYLIDIDILKTIDERLLIFSQQNIHDKIDEYALVWNTANSLLVQIKEVMGNDFITYEKFYDIFMSGISDITLSVIPPAINQVLISSIDRFRNHNAKVVIVLGVNDGIFPKPFKHEGIISDDERNELAELGIELADTQEYRQIEEQNLIYTTLTAPSEKLFIFTPSSQKDGKPLNKSYINVRLRQIFSDLTEVTPTVETPSAHGSFAPEIPEKLSAASARMLYGDPVWLSVSRVEKYNSCAFSFFLQYGLMLKPRAAADFKITERGSLLHSVLAEYFSQLKSENTDYSVISRQSCYNSIKELCGGVIQTQYSMLYELSPSFKYFTRRIQNVAQITAWSIVKFYKRSEFRPFGFEIAFRPNGLGQFPSRDIHVDGGRGVLVGNIDRADTASIDGTEYISIIDYKSSAKKIDSELVENGVQIQPLVYCGMMCEQIENAKPAAMLYMPMDEPLIKKADENISDEALDNDVTKNLRMDGWVLNDEKISLALDNGMTENGKSDFIPTSQAAKLIEKDMLEQIEKANQAIYKATQNMLTGNIAIRAKNIKNYNPCQWCDYASICTRSSRRFNQM